MNSADIILTIVIILISSVVTYQIGKWLSQKLGWEK